MKYPKFLLAAGAYIGIGFTAIHLRAVHYSDKMAGILEKQPSPDLYANNEGYQYMAYWYTYGLGWLVSLLLIGCISLIWYNKRKYGNT